jgi:hypothetical protein
VTRPRATDDFDTIYRRIKELRRETVVTAPSAEADQPVRADTPLTDPERRLKDRREGLPPPWVPTIFLKKPTNSEIARRFRPTPLRVGNRARPNMMPECLSRTIGADRARPRMVLPLSEFRHTTLS